MKNLAQSNTRGPLEIAMYALFYAAAVAAQQETSKDLAELRISIEERRYSIQRSAVYAGEYEQTVRAAADAKASQAEIDAATAGKKKADSALAATRKSGSSSRHDGRNRRRAGVRRDSPACRSEETGR